MESEKHLSGKFCVVMPRVESNRLDANPHYVTFCPASTKMPTHRTAPTKQLFAWIQAVLT